ncbi:GGDEF domain-containing protein [Stutzerimonas stutzeri]|uniref:diguanylate cyclase n=1 Tax=Stutzerimonas stutzeri TaxID=316 RepID=A0A2N8SY91_STUST|nr:GGDEF domain-containing protein [Stutzerimonas stutzeri]MCQ4326531.1 GGDEF domain-containing protein [Stutzerimonas stutzeri]PNG07447.1 GGDEF domain-containing protein [Stutzerimonas stutzeri]
MKRVQGKADLQQIRQMRLLQHVDEPCLAALLDKFETCDIDAHEVLLSPHKPNRHLYLVLHGELTVHLDSMDNQPLRVIETGDCVGEVSFCDQHFPSAYVVAHRPSRLLRLHCREFACLARSPQVMQNLATLLCERVRLCDQVIVRSEHNANIDMLTGVFNRRWLEHIFERESTRCAFNHRPLSMLMLDIDRFKSYNDSHGHLTGDRALCLVARTLGSQLRPKDSLVRFGGEEFVILLPELELDEARRIAERLRQSVEQAASGDASVGALPDVTISIGLAQLRPHDTLEDLINRADQALYQAKERGRNCLCG